MVTSNGSNVLSPGSSVTPLPSSRMKKPSVPLGLVFSRSGPYEMMAGEMLKSASMAVDEVNQSDAFDFTFAPHLRIRVASSPPIYACADLIREERAITSLFHPQRPSPADRPLWHPARYEGRRQRQRHLRGRSPITPWCRWRHMLDHIDEVFCIGSNYV